MIGTGRKKSIAFFISFGAALIVVTLLLYIGGVVLDWHRGLKLILGILLLAVIVAGVVLNTVFLVREIRRNEQHDAFINAVTHELKTPIASIRLHLETLQLRELQEARKQEFYRLMLSDADRLTETVEQVLKAGRAGDKRAGVERAEVDFGLLVRDCVDAVRVQHHLQPEAMRFEFTAQNGAEARVKGSAEDLRTAVSNLLDNAIKYSGQRVEVQVRLEENDRRVVLRVQDQGVGIAPDDLKRIFKRFQRLGNRSMAHVKGTGLGLFIVKAIAKKHGGRAFAESDGEGHGTTVVLDLPRAGA